VICAAVTAAGSDAVAVDSHALAVLGQAGTPSGHRSRGRPLSATRVISTGGPGESASPRRLTVTGAPPCRRALPTRSAITMSKRCGASRARMPGPHGLDHRDGHDGGGGRARRASGQGPRSRTVSVEAAHRPTSVSGASTTATGISGVPRRRAGRHSPYRGTVTGESVPACQ
jgi:hypothetical protein